MVRLDLGLFQLSFLASNIIADNLESGWPEFTSLESSADASSPWPSGPLLC